VSRATDATTPGQGADPPPASAASAASAAFDAVGPGNLVILFDGVCALCNGLNKFVLKRDRRDRFRFTPLQGEVARNLLIRHGKDPDQLDTVYLVLSPGTDAERLLARGRAALKIIRSVGGAWHLMAVFAILPTFILDFFYNLVARNRYRAFGKYDECPIPPSEHRHRFL
jgi:predicted DCC family thiol-disulfide oxidoreductase YuxK